MGSIFSYCSHANILEPVWFCRRLNQDSKPIARIRQLHFIIKIQYFQIIQFHSYKNWVNFVQIIYTLKLYLLGCKFDIFSVIENCLKGNEYNSTTRKCDPCNHGFFKNISGNHIDCYQCPVNHTTKVLGATDITQCKPGISLIHFKRVRSNHIRSLFLSNLIKLQT